MSKFLIHFFITMPMTIGCIIYVMHIDQIKNHAVVDFSLKAYERGIMVACEGYDGYFWECNE